MFNDDSNRTWQRWKLIFGYISQIPTSDLYLWNKKIPDTPRPNRAVGSTKWTNTFDFNLLKYTIRIIENATFQNIFACGFFFMAIFVYCKYKKMTWKPLISSIFAQKYNFLSWLPYPKAPFMHLAYSKQS